MKICRRKIYHLTGDRNRMLEDDTQLFLVKLAMIFQCLFFPELLFIKLADFMYMIKPWHDNKIVMGQNK